MAGLFGESDPKREIIPLDADTQNLINAASKRSQQSDSALAGDLNAGVTQSIQSTGLTSPDQTQQRAAQTGEDFGMMNAIRNQYKGIANKDINSVVRKNNSNVPLLRSNLLSQASAYNQAQTQVQTDAFVKLQEANMMADQARANALRGVLGGVGAMVGAVAAGNGNRRRPQQQRSGGESMDGMQMGGGAMDSGGQDPFSVA